MFKPSRLVDLSHSIIPDQEEYRLELDTRLTNEWPQFAQYECQDGEWYIISEVTMNTHVGTHIEFPYHHIKTDADATQYPLERLIGDAVVIDISAWANNQEIDLAGLREVSKDLLREGDIAFFYTGNDRFYRTSGQHNRPWFAPDAIEWLAKEKKISVMGVDTSGIEVRNPDGSAFQGQPNHLILLSEGIALVEYLANLDKFVNQRFIAFILPVKIQGAEAFPVRVIGIQL